MDLAGQLRELRGQMTQGRLAEILGVSNALVSSWENEHSVPSEQHLRDYANTFRPGRPGELLEELLALHSQARKYGAVRQTDLLEEIRSLLAEILGRMPER